MADLFDRFTGAVGALSAHTSDSGHTWSGGAADVALSGSDSIRGNTFSPVDACFSSWTPPGTDYAVSIVVGDDWVNGPEAGSGLGIEVRGSGSNGAQNYYTAYSIGASPAQHVGIYRVVGGSPTQLGMTQTYSPQIATNDVLTLTVASSDDTVTLTLYLNGTQVYQIEDTDEDRILTADKAGFFLRDNDPDHADTIRTVWAGAIGGPSEGVSPSSATVAVSGTQSFSATGGLTNEVLNWTAAHGSFTGSPGTMVTYNAPASGTSDVATWTSADLPTHTATASITLDEGGTLALSGPSSGTTGSASTHSTVTATSLSGSDTVSPASDSGGTFSSSSQVFASGSSSHTFTHTPSTDGVRAISITDTLGATVSGSPVTYTSTTPTPSPSGPPNRSRNGVAAAVRRAADIAGLRAQPIAQPERAPAVKLTPTATPLASPIAPAPPERPAISDTRPDKAKLDFPIRGGK